MLAAEARLQHQPMVLLIHCSADNRLAFPDEIHTVPWAVIDPEFRYSVTHSFRVAEASQ